MREEGRVKTNNTKLGIEGIEILDRFISNFIRNIFSSHINICIFCLIPFVNNI